MCFFNLKWLLLSISSFSSSSLIKAFILTTSSTSSLFYSYIFHQIIKKERKKPNKFYVSKPTLHIEALYFLFWLPQKVTYNQLSLGSIIVHSCLPVPLEGCTLPLCLSQWGAGGVSLRPISIGLGSLIATCSVTQLLQQNFHTTFKQQLALCVEMSKQPGF